MDNLASNTASESHTLASFPTEIWSSLLRLLSLRDILVLTETGSKRVSQHIRSCVRSLHLSRSRIIPQRISPSFILKWHGLHNLNIDCIRSSSEEDYCIRVNMLPPTLRSLTMTLPADSLLQFINPLSDPHLDSTSQYNYLPNLTELNITIMLSLAVDLLVEADYTPFGRWLQKLPLTSLHQTSYSLPPQFIAYLPASLTSIKLKLESGFDESISEEDSLKLPSSTFSSFSSLSTLHLHLASDFDWDEGVIPSTVTNLKIAAFSELPNLLYQLPPNLVSMDMSTCVIDSTTAPLLPRSLKSLTFANITNSALPLLPPSLTELRCAVSRRRYNFDPIVLPRSLITLNLSLQMMPAVWKNLPKSLERCSFRFPPIDPVHLELVPHLPPSLTSITLHKPTYDLIRALPCQSAVKELILSRQSLDKSPLEHCLAELVNFCSLTRLNLDVDADLSQFSLLNAPLEYLSLFVLEHRMNDLVFPASCLRSLKELFFHRRTKSEVRSIKSLPWLPSLPTSLERLTIKNMCLDPSSLSTLPASCHRLEFETLLELFEFSQLKQLPQTIRDLKVFILECASSDDLEDDTPVLPTFETFLSEILSSLPHQIRMFNAEGPKFVLREPESTWVEIFRTHLSHSLPFLGTFQMGSISHAFVQAAVSLQL